MGLQCGADLHISLLGAQRHGDVWCRCREDRAADAFNMYIPDGILHLRHVVCWGDTLIGLGNVCRVIL